MSENGENADVKLSANDTTDCSRKFKLRFGYRDKENPDFTHNEVVISRRPKGANVLNALFMNASGEAGADIQINLALIASSITKFGNMKMMPPPLTALLSLNELDRDKLNDEYALFLTATHPNNEQEILEDKRVRLAFGIERDGVKYDAIEFGYFLTGYDEINLRNEAQSDWHFAASKMAREVVKISTADDSKSLSGALTLEEIEAMDATDYIVLREAESQWLNSFRLEQIAD